MCNFNQLKNEVINQGNCVACGTCLGLFPDQLIEVEHSSGPRPILRSGAELNSNYLLDSCPGYSINYGELNKEIFGKEITDYLVGNYQESWIGYTKNPKIRRNGASGGVLTAILIYLLEEGLVDGVVVIEQGNPDPWSARPIIATNPEKIKECSQSVYVPVMTNKFLNEAKYFKGNLAYVGLPFQVASLRRLQVMGHKDALKVKYVFGPYKGTSIYFEAIKSYLRSNGVKGLEEVAKIKYRDGEWPGYLRIDLKNGRILRSPKFYYNYLIPFFITKESLISVDFTNELTDLSVGDAWSPKYENQAGGFSVVLARSEKALILAKEMENKGLLALEPVTHDEVLQMHAHMIDFKKRGSFIRIKILRLLRRKYPQYDYRPESIHFTRYFIELIISLFLLICSTKPSRILAEKVPGPVLGWVFDFLRRFWKFISKPTKRKGLTQVSYNQH